VFRIIFDSVIRHFNSVPRCSLKDRLVETNLSRFDAEYARLSTKSPIKKTKNTAYKYIRECGNVRGFSWFVDVTAGKKRIG